MTSAVSPDVTVVICAYTEQRWEQLLFAVQAASEELLPTDRLVVVTDHNDALLVAAQRRFGGRRQVLVVPNDGPRGLSGARNTGTAVATTDLVAFVDDDAAVQPGWRPTLLRHFESSDVAAVGGYAEPVWPDERPRWLPPECDWVVGCSHAGLPTQLASVRNIIGCNMAFRRDALLAIGGFNTSIGRVGRHPVGCEETECCIRISQRLGLQILFEPGARVSHHVAGERTRIGYLVRRSFGEGISKRKVSVLVGSRDATSTERSYLSTAVPRAFARGVRETISPTRRRAAPGGLARSSVLMLGVGAAGAGYLYAMAHERTSPRAPEPSWR